MFKDDIPVVVLQLELKLIAVPVTLVQYVTGIRVLDLTVWFKVSTKPWED